MQRLICSLHITHIIFTLSSHRSLTEMTVTRAVRASGNKINHDKHRLMHMHAPRLYKCRCHHRPATDTENITHSTSHMHICTSSRTHTQVRTPADPCPRIYTGARHLSSKEALVTAPQQVVMLRVSFAVLAGRPHGRR